MENYALNGKPLPVNMGRVAAGHKRTYERHCQSCVVGFGIPPHANATLAIRFRSCPSNAPCKLNVLAVSSC